MVDVFVHTITQHRTDPVNANVQDRKAEGLQMTLIEEGPKVLVASTDYDASEAARINRAIVATRSFFESKDLSTQLSSQDIREPKLEAVLEAAA